MNLPNTLFLPELREMLAEQNAAELREFCTALHPARTADFMEGLTPAEAWQVLQYAELPTRVEIFGYFPREKQLEIIRHADRAEIAELLARLPPDDCVDILHAVEPELAEQLVASLPVAERRTILRLRAYPENTAGAVMTTEFARLSENLTVREALEELARQASELETIYYIYIVDEQDHLRGLVSARQLVSAIGKPETLLRDLMETELLTVNINEDQEEVARRVARFDLLAIPVVDREYHMLGIITHDDVIDVMVEEATEDAHRMGGMMPLVDNYLESSFVTVWRKRAGWLSLLFLAELFTFTALASFEDAIKQVIALSLFVPLCISTGGNSGSQAATLITRAIALGHVTVRDWLRVLWHELGMGLALGATLGAIGFVRAALTPQRVLGDVNAWQLGLVIAQAVAVICLWGTITGAMLPILFKRLGLDPGFASSPFVATFVDVTGIVIYFSIASVFLL
ncbi:MAG: magnesium transporter [Thermoguttaceae bacterium]